MFRAILSRAGVALFAFASGGAFAATITVTNLADSGAGSLRAALAAAIASDTINFNAALSGTIPLVTELAVNTPVTIVGNGVGVITLDGQNAVRVINVATAGIVNISALTVANGTDVGLGGGILLSGGTLNLSNVAVLGNTAGNGGGMTISAATTATVDNSTFGGNSTTGTGGGAILAQGNLVVTRSTFNGNSSFQGGAINVQPGATVSVVNSTFSGNTSTSLGGVFAVIGSATVDSSTFSQNTAPNTSGSVFAGNGVTLNNSVFVNNAAAVAPGAINGPTAGSNNLFFNNTAAAVPDDATGYGTTNPIIALANPLLPLGNNGGPTLTMLPVLGGAAICAGNPALLPPGTTTDQRGLPRLRLGGACLDAGAVELVVPVVPAGPVNVPTLSSFALLLLALTMLGAGLAMRRRM